MAISVNQRGRAHALDRRNLRPHAPHAFSQTPTAPQGVVSCMKATDMHASRKDRDPHMRASTNGWIPARSHLGTFTDTPHRCRVRLQRVMGVAYSVLEESAEEAK